MAAIQKRHTHIAVLAVLLLVVTMLGDAIALQPRQVEASGGTGKGGGAGAALSDVETLNAHLAIGVGQVCAAECQVTLQILSDSARTVSVALPPGIALAFAVTTVHGLVRVLRSPSRDLKQKASTWLDQFSWVFLAAMTCLRNIRICSFLATSLVAAVCVGVFFVPGVDAACGLTEVAGPVALIIAAATVVAEGILTLISIDPPDPSFHQIASPVGLPAIVPRSPLGPDGQTFLNLYRNLSDQVAYGRAFTTSLNRAQGAIAAGSAEWLGKQLQAAVGFAWHLATLDGQMADVVAPFQNKPPVTSSVLTTAQVREFQAQLTNAGLSASETHAMRLYGLTDQDIQTALQRSGSADPDQVAALTGRTWFGMLAQPPILATIRGSAAAYATFARVASETQASISEIDDQPLWISGETADQQGAVVRSEDGGKRWTAVRVPGTARVLSTTFPDAAHGWAVGLDARFAPVAASSHDGGRTWTRSSIPSLGSGGVLTAISFGDALTGFATGSVCSALGDCQGMVIATRDGGATWSGPITLPGTELLDGLSFFDLAHGVAVGRSTASDGQGVIATTADGGQTWSVQQEPAAADILAVRFADPQHVWAVGNSLTGSVVAFTSTDAGSSWSTTTARSAGGFGTGIASADGIHGWIVGAAGGEFVETTADGGHQWTLHSPPVPSITSIEPTAGSPDGCTLVTIHGTGFKGSHVLQVSFGAADALRFQVMDDHTIRSVTPPASQAVVPGLPSDVSVVVSGFGGAAFATQTFTYADQSAQHEHECEDDSAAKSQGDSERS